jgi:hypothetical protein
VPGFDTKKTDVKVFSHIELQLRNSASLGNADLRSQESSRKSNPDNIIEKNVGGDQREVSKFLKLESGTVFVNQPEYYLDRVEKILAILLRCVGGESARNSGG